MRKNQSSIMECSQITLEDWLDLNRKEELSTPTSVQSEDLADSASTKPKNKQVMTPDLCMKECIRLVERLGQTHGRWEVFSDFIQMFAIAISNQVDSFHRKERDKLYSEITGKYSKEEMKTLSEIGGHLTMAAVLLMDSPRDLLGPMFHEMNLHNEWIGQFFTPQYVCDMMAEITIGDNDAAMEKGYLTVCEPACGSGAMLLGMAKALQKRGLPTNSMVANATDVDLRCVCMAYIQLSLYGIPAVVNYGNSITLEQWSCWYTPAYVRGDWQRKLCGG